MARYNTSESSSASSSDESRDLANHHSASEEEEVAEALAVAVEKEDSSNIDGGNIDNFPVVPLPSGFKEEPEGSRSSWDPGLEIQVPFEQRPVTNLFV